MNITAIPSRSSGLNLHVIYYQNVKNAQLRMNFVTARGL